MIELHQDRALCLLLQQPGTAFLRDRLGGLLMGRTSEGSSHHPHHPRKWGLAPGYLTSALLGSPLWPGAKVHLSGPPCLPPQNQMDRVCGILSPCCNSRLWRRVFFFMATTLTLQSRSSFLHFTFRFDFGLRNGKETKQNCGVILH